MLSCWCGREIPVTVLWVAFATSKPLVCSKCERAITRENLLHCVEHNVCANAAYAAYRQITRYGWTSSGALCNATGIGAKVIGGLLAGLQRSGLIQKYEGEQTLAMGEDTIFEAGPNFPPQSARLKKQEEALPPDPPPNAVC